MRTMVVLYLIFFFGCKESPTPLNNTEGLSTITLSTSVYNPFDFVGVQHNIVLDLYEDEFNNERFDSAGLNYIVFYGGKTYTKWSIKDTLLSISDTTNQLPDGILDTLYNIYDNMSIVDVSGLDTNVNYQDFTGIDFLTGAKNLDCIDQSVYDLLDSIFLLADGGNETDINNYFGNLDTANYNMNSNDTLLFIFKGVYQHSKEYWDNYSVVSESITKKSGKMLLGTSEISLTSQQRNQCYLVDAAVAVVVAYVVGSNPFTAALALWTAKELAAKASRSVAQQHLENNRNGVSS